ncbi:porin [Glaciimonas sp. PCH181]|uniref:porin n=1 Tax=Glaciimonas sp. PCH181 TaxID=2133943 RepID=UPI000D36847C|nr:porin [Glaciimonas sp. PCH181]PUA17164.1 porin [Glaciimonas sp. PCH181]
MKKSLITLAILSVSAGAVQAHGSVNIYGVVDTGLTFSNNIEKNDGTGNGGKFSMNSGVIQGSRIGFKGTEDLGGGLNAVFQLESGFSSDTGGQSRTNNGFNRKSVVGLSGNFGTFLMGNQTDMLEDAGDLTSNQDFGSIVGLSAHNFNRLGGIQVRNSIRYNTPNLNGFTGSVIYGFGEQAGKANAGQSFGLGGIYKNGPLGLYLGYFQAKLGRTPSDALVGTIVDLLPKNLKPTAKDDGLTATKTVSLGGSYQAGPARLYGNWSRFNVPTLIRQDVYEIGSDFALSAPLHLLASVQHVRYTTDVEITSKKPKTTQLNLGVDYWLSKRTDVYGFMSYAKGSNGSPVGVWDYASQESDDSSKQASMSIGIRHKF